MFAGEVTHVAREVGTEGRLGGQVRVTNVGGMWKDLTDNVNIMAANLTLQVRTIAVSTSGYETVVPANPSPTLAPSNNGYSYVIPPLRSCDDRLIETCLHDNIRVQESDITHIVEREHICHLERYKKQVLRALSLTILEKSSGHRRTYI